jgi:hypothetical protein
MTGGNEMPLRSKKIRQLGERVVVEMDIPDDWQPGRRCGPKRTYVEIQVVKSNGLAKGAPDYEF